MSANKGVVLAGLSPHPPIVVPEVGGRDSSKVKDTHCALRLLAGEIVRANIHTVVVIGPHGTVFRDAVSCIGDARITGDLGRFGAPRASVDFANDLELCRLIKEATEGDGGGSKLVMLGAKERLQYRTGEGLDHGATIPLYYLKISGYSGHVVVLTMAYLSYSELYEFGRSVSSACEKSGKRVCVIASGDLSHRLTKEAPAGFHPRGRDFDALVMESIKRADPTPLVDIDEDLAEDAGECGLRPVIMMLGALDGRAVTSSVLSYEGPFGVGYGVAMLTPGGSDPAREYAATRRLERASKMRQLRTNESAHVKLARETLEAYIRDHKRLSSADAPDSLKKEQAVAFVSLKKNGQLRGCIGTTEPTTPTLADEIIQNAISAGTQDPRFSPIDRTELQDIVYSVDVLSEATPVESYDDLDPKTYGVIVERGSRRGLLLPDLEGVDTIQKQVSIAKQKAGIRPEEKPEIYRFTVTRYH